MCAVCEGSPRCSPARPPRDPFRRHGARSARRRAPGRDVQPHLLSPRPGTWHGDSRDRGGPRRPRSTARLSRRSTEACGGGPILPSKACRRRPRAAGATGAGAFAIDGRLPGVWENRWRGRPVPVADLSALPGLPDRVPPVVRGAGQGIRKRLLLRGVQGAVRPDVPGGFRRDRGGRAGTDHADGARARTARTRPPTGARSSTWGAPTGRSSPPCEPRDGRASASTSPRMRSSTCGRYCRCRPPACRSSGSSAAGYPAPGSTASRSGT